jgi:hypothetical protein
MTELEDSNGNVRRDEAHEGWLAMQAAYAEYLRASEVFENGRELARDSAEQGCFELTLLDCRRDAFERYLEARLEYLENRFDQGYRREAAPAPRPSGETGGLRAFFRPAGPKWLMAVLAAGILSVIVFSLVREQKHARELDWALAQLRANASNAGDHLQLPAKELEAKGPTEPSAAAAPTAQPPAPAVRADGRRPSGLTARHPHERIIKTASRSVAARSYFSLSRSPHFKRVGSIKVSLKSVDVQRNFVDVAILSESGKLNVQRLRPNQRVRIQRSDRGQPTELVVDRITANGLSGHLIEFHG